MYERYFALERPAFAKAADPRFFYRSGPHDQAVAHLLYAAESGEVALLTGEIGCGKTMVTRVILEELSRQPHFALAAPPYARLSPAGVQEAVAEALGIEAPARGRERRMADIRRAIRGLADRGGTLVLLLDEAQLLSAPETFEEIRLLTNFQTKERSLVSVLLVGQPELLAKIRHPRLASLRQRVGLRFHLEPLSREEVPAYLHHRLLAAGAPDPDLFDPLAADGLHRLSGGIPRLLNTLATQVLLQAMAEGRTKIDAATVAAVERDLRWPDRASLAAKESLPWWT